ncbi:hypothetical protein ACFX1S_039983 [Malus domestica]
MAAAAAVAVSVVVKVLRSGLEGGMGRWDLGGSGVGGGFGDVMVVLVAVVVVEEKVEGENMVAMGLLRGVVFLLFVVFNLTFSLSKKCGGGRKFGY